MLSTLCQRHAILEVDRCSPEQLCYDQVVIVQDAEPNAAEFLNDRMVASLKGRFNQLRSVHATPVENVEDEDVLGAPSVLGDTAVADTREHLDQVFIFPGFRHDEINVLCAVLEPKKGQCGPSTGYQAHPPPQIAVPQPQPVQQPIISYAIIHTICCSYNCNLLYYYIQQLRSQSSVFSSISTFRTMPAP